MIKLSNIRKAIRLKRMAFFCCAIRIRTWNVGSWVPGVTLTLSRHYGIPNETFAEAVGVEPTRHYCSTVFKTGSVASYRIALPNICGRRRSRSPKALPYTLISNQVCIPYSSSSVFWSRIDYSIFLVIFSSYWLFCMPGRTWTLSLSGRNRVFYH